MTEEPKIEPGQVWRKPGPYNWIKITHIEDPDYPPSGTDCKIIGVGYIDLNPSIKRINLSRGDMCFYPGQDWEKFVRENRFIYIEGQPKNMI